MNKLISILACISAIFSSCTYSINMIHSEGSASDLIDEQQTPTANVSATVPISAI